METVDNEGMSRRAVLKRSAVAGSVLFSAGVVTAGKGDNPGGNGRGSESGEARGNEHTGGRILLDSKPPAPRYFNGDRPVFFAHSVGSPVETPFLIEEAETDQTGPCFPVNARQQYKTVFLTWEINEIPAFFGVGAIRQSQKMVEWEEHYEVVTHRPCSEANDLYMAMYRPRK